MQDIPRPTGNHSQPRYVAFTAAILLVLSSVATLGLSADASAQDADSAPPSATEPAATPSPTKTDPLEKAEQKRQAWAGLLAVAGIAIAGIGLATVTILWGARLRRETRKSSPPSAPRDDLWFLRPPKSPPPSPETRGD